MSRPARLDSGYMHDSDLIPAIEAWRERHDIKPPRLAQILHLKQVQTYQNWITRGRIPDGHIPAVAAVIHSPSESAAVLAVKEIKKMGLSGLALAVRSPALQEKTAPDLKELIRQAALRVSPEVVIAAILPLFDDVSLELRVETARKILEKSQGD